MPTDEQIEAAVKAMLDADDFLHIIEIEGLEAIARAALSAAEAREVNAAYLRAFDAAGEYLNEQYSNMALFNQIDRDRILAKLEAKP